MQKNNPSQTSDVPHPFIQRYQADVTGVLHGWDRLRLQGTLRTLYYGPVMERYLFKAGVLWKDYKSYVTRITERVRQAAADLAGQQQRPILYLPSSRTEKEGIALRAQRERPVSQGLVAVLSCVEPCRTWFARGNRQTRKLELKMQWGKCLHLYFYCIHEVLGWISVRLQTWFPFLIQVCLNGREWLARQMDAEGLAYRRQDNSFSWVADTARAQALLDQQNRTDWPKLLQPLVRFCHPLHQEIMRPLPRDYYWTIAESEYAYDVMFRSRKALQRIYPKLTMNDPRDFRVWRCPESNPAGKPQWRILRRGVADIYRRAEVSRAGVERYLAALAAVNVSTPLAEEAAGVCQPTRQQGRRYRALNAFGHADAQLLLAVNRGEFAANGFRNRDIRAHLYPCTQDSLRLRRQMGATGRRMRLLRAHGLIRKVSKTHRYVVTDKGRRIITALLTARQASTDKLIALAA